MGGWAARYEDGYTTNDGASVTVTDRQFDAQPWDTPGTAVRHWASRPDLRGPGVRAYGNGLEQVDDVRARPEFAALGIASIWRRVTFLPAQPPPGSADPLARRPVERGEDLADVDIECLGQGKPGRDRPARVTHLDLHDAAPGDS